MLPRMKEEGSHKKAAVKRLQKKKKDDKKKGGAGKKEAAGGSAAAPVNEPEPPGGGTKLGVTNEYLNAAKKIFQKKWDGKQAATANLSDFEIIRTLGTGQFGRVMFVKHIKSNIFMALKILERQKVVGMGQAEHVIYEKKVLYSINYPFLVHYRYHFKDNASLYLVLEFVPGGELFGQLQKAGKFPDNQSKMYCAEVALALEYLHHVGIVYRDLKPENLLIDENGYIKITDFGFAKRIDDGKTSTMCGTPEYLAPEIVKSQGYDYGVDWWALGVLTYEMIVGKSPFASESPQHVMERIMKGKVLFDKGFNADAQKVIEGLTKVDMSKRACAKEMGGPTKFKQLAWFKSLDWGKLYLQALPAPYKPKIKGLADTSNFEDYDEKPLLELPEEVHGKTFQDF